MKNKILFVATSDIHINTFHIPYLEWFFKNGHEIHLAAENRANIKVPYISTYFDLNFPRTVFSLKNYSTYKELKKIIDVGNYDLIHCHTPIPSAIARLAARSARKKGTKLLYTAHGFHFYRGAPLTKWLAFYPVERQLANMTDGIITINAEDYYYAKIKMDHSESYYIKGIGVNSNKFKPALSLEKDQAKKRFGFKNDDFLLLYVAEFIARKNHSFLIDAMVDLICKYPKIKLIFAGKGELMDDMLKKRDSLKLNDHIVFLGFRSDVEELVKIADIGVSSSIHEGLGLGLAEEMLCAVPIIATVDRGHKEMVINGYNGYLFAQGNQTEFIDYVSELYENNELRQILGRNAYIKAQEFTIENSLASMVEIYRKYLKS